MNFGSHTDAVVRMAVALVNLLTPGEDRSRIYAPPTGVDRAAALNTLFKSVGSRTEVSPAQGDAFTPVAADLRVVFALVAAGDFDSAAHRVNDMLTSTGAHPLLARHDGEPWHIHFHSAEPTSPAESWAAGCATGLAIVLGSELHERLGVCTAPHCDRVYVDTSRNGSKRFCSTACQNRVKAAAFRDRHGTSA